MTRSNFTTILIVTLTISLFFIVLSFTLFSINGSKFTKEGELIKTGSVKLKIEPDNVDFKVFVDGEETDLYRDLITGLTGPSHNLRIEARGYTTWEGAVKVNPGYVTTKFIKVFPLKTDWQAITNSNIDDIFYSPHNDYVYYTVINDTQDKTQLGIWQYKLTKSLLDFPSTEKPKLISDLNSKEILSILGEDYTILPSADNKSLLLSKSDLSKILILDNLNDKSVKVTNLNKTLGYTPSNVEWFKANESLIIQKDDLLFEYRLNNKKKILISHSPEQNIEYSYDEDRILYINPQDKNSIWIYQNEVSQKLKGVESTDINSIHLQADLLVFEAKNNIFGYNFKNNKEYLLATDYQLQKINSLATAAIYSKNNNYFYAEIKLDPKTQSLINDISKGGLLQTNLDFAYNTDLLIDFDEKSGSIVISDAEEKNNIQLSKLNGILDYKYAFNEKGDRLFALSQLGGKTNLYSLELE